MGLDMFLHKEKREEIAYWRKANAVHAWFSRLHEKQTDGSELENCEDLYVTKEDLIELRDTCKKVLASSELVYKEVPVKEYDYDKKEYVMNSRMMKVLDDPSVAEELMPTQSGFFYGSTVYGELYVESLEDTVNKINEILADIDFEEYNIVYHAWW